MARGVVLNGYFFFRFDVFFADFFAAFAVFFAFFAFLAMFPSVIPEVGHCKSTFDVHTQNTPKLRN
jgi:hypothetical protein